MTVAVLLLSRRTLSDPARVHDDDDEECRRVCARERRTGECAHVLYTPEVCGEFDITYITFVEGGRGSRASVKRSQELSSIVSLIRPPLLLSSLINSPTRRSFPCFGSVGPHFHDSSWRIVSASGCEEIPLNRQRVGIVEVRSISQSPRLDSGLTREEQEVTLMLEHAGYVFLRRPVAQ